MEILNYNAKIGENRYQKQHPNNVALGILEKYQNSTLLSAYADNFMQQIMFHNNLQRDNLLQVERILCLWAQTLMGRDAAQMPGVVAGANTNTIQAQETCKSSTFLSILRVQLPFQIPTAMFLLSLNQDPGNIWVSQSLLALFSSLSIGLQNSDGASVL
ncbi:hypothetical protein ACJX0J_018186, partial [Zea mays]